MNVITVHNLIVSPPPRRFQPLRDCVHSRQMKITLAGAIFVPCMVSLVSPHQLVRPTREGHQGRMSTLRVCQARSKRFEA